MENSNIILQLPFDESAGATKTYDYSASRDDGQVSGATFVSGKNGNAISFNDAKGTCTLASPLLDNLPDVFTLLAWVQSKKVDCGTPSQIIVLLNFDGDDDFVEIPIDVKPETWYYFAVVREGVNFSVYVNNTLKDTVSHGGTLVGLAFNQDYYGGDYGLGLLDDVVIYNEALTQSEISSASSGVKNALYTIDGIDFKTFGVYVSSSSGILNRPNIKTPASIDWDDYHGESVDLNHIYYDKREITLGCFLKADSKASFIDQVRQFEEQFNGKGLHRLVIDVHPTKPLIYMVYCKDAIEITKTWSDDLMVGTFNLKLIEPEPVKRVLKHIRSSANTATCEVQMTSTKYLNVFWGDGKVDYDVCGALGKSVVIFHEYEEDGEYFPVITGCIDEIESFDTNAIVVWEKI